MSADLKECPFCGSAAMLEDHRTIWRVACASLECGAQVLGDRAPEPDGEMGDTYWNGIKQTAIDRWNARAITPPVAAGSVDTANLTMWLKAIYHAADGHQLNERLETALYHINLYAEQAKEAGKQEALDLTGSVGQLRQRAEKAEAELESWVHTNRVDELQRNYSAALARIMYLEAELRIAQSC